MHTATVRTIYWMPSGFSFAPNYQTIVNGFINNVAADSNKTSNVYSSDTQYSDTTLGNIQYNITAAGSFVDTDSFPPLDSANCPTSANCITDAQVIAELEHLQGLQGWPGGYGNLYILLLPRNVDECAGPDGLGGFECSTNVFCAYHSGDGLLSDPTILYAVEPYFAIGDPTGCDSGEHPNGNDADVAINTISHEMNEAITDPAGFGWYEGNFDENGDKCAWNFGSHLGNTGAGSSDFNQIIGAGRYFLQREWSNALNGCYQVGAPTVSLDATVGAEGTSIGITGTNFFATPPATPVVKFNGIVSPSVTVNSPTHLTAQVPVGNVAGHVTVQAVGGTGTSTQFFGQPTINNFSPSSAHAGDTVTVNGTGFFGVTSVKFNGVPATFGNVTGNGTSLRAVVPLAATDGPISVTGSGGTSGGSDTFTVLPTITSFTPASGPSGTTLTINGSGFGAFNGVTFIGDGDADGINVSHSVTQILVQVPTNAKVGPITVYTHSGTPTTVTSTASFTPLLSVSGLNHSSAKPGDTVVVNGANFTAHGPVSVSVNGVVACTSCTATSTTVSFTVPNAVGGAVTVTNQDGSATAASSLAILPRIDSMSVNGGSVTLRGAGFAGTTSVAFGGGSERAVYTISPAGTTLQVTVPAGATTGKIAVTNAGGTTLTASNFVVAPTISAFAPASVQVGGTIGVSGAGLDSADRVDFTGGVSAVPTSVTGTSLQVVVPAGAQSGVFSVHTSSGSVSSGRPLTITFSVSRFSPAKADYGATVTLTGSALTGVTAVLFNGVAGTNVTVVDDSHVTVTVPATGSLTGQITVVKGGVPVHPSGLFTLFGVHSATPPAGGPSTTVVIAGVGFSGVTRVRFGGVDAEFTVDSDTQITAKVPPLATSGPLTVSVPGAVASIAYSLS